jgi:hypothetical protein
MHWILRPTARARAKDEAPTLFKWLRHELDFTNWSANFDKHDWVRRPFQVELESDIPCRPHS